jgi:hypothetical protein
MQSSTVLFLAANPVAVQVLQLGEECRAIEHKIRAAKFRDQIRFHSRWAARPDDLLQALNEDTPSVLHFSGHGAGDQGLCFQAEDGSAQHVSAEGLAQVMRAAGTSVMVVVLNACYSEVQAQALVAHVPCVVGMPDAIGDEAAIIYAASFYGALAFGKSVGNAHQQGLAALALQPTGGPARDIQAAEGAPPAPAPLLLTRQNTDANHVYIVHASGDPPAAPPSPAVAVPAPEGSMARSRHREWGIYKLLAGLLFLLTVAMAISVAISSGKTPPASPGASFGLAVRLHGPAGLFDDVCTSGTVTLDIGTDRRSEKTSNGGLAYFAEIPGAFANQSVPIAATCEGYEADEGSSRVTLVPGQPSYVAMHKQCGDHRCGPGETHRTCPDDCSAITNDAWMGTILGVDAANVVDAVLGVDATVPADAGESARYHGPCTRTPGGIVPSASASCPKLKPDEPDVRVIMREAKERGDTCTDIYRCK